MELERPAWNVTLVLQSLTCTPYEPLRLSLERHLTLKMCFFLALASAKRVSELHGLLCKVKYSRTWSSYTFSFVPSFVAKVKNPSLPDMHFDKFAIPSLVGFMDRDRRRCCSTQFEPSSAIFLGWINVVLSAITFSTPQVGRKKKCDEEYNISWFKYLISEAYRTASDSNCTASHEGWNLGISDHSLHSVSGMSTTSLWLYSS